MTEKLNFPAEDGSDQVFVMSRELNAPRDLVWKAFTEPDRLIHWFGPKGFSTTLAKMDFHPGGTCHYCMDSPDGTEMWGKCVYREIEPQDKIVYINSFSNAGGATTRHPMSATWPLEMLTTFTFEDLGPKTRFTLRWEPWKSGPEERATFAAAHDGMTQGWNGSLERLDQYLASTQ